MCVFETAVTECILDLDASTQWSKKKKWIYREKWDSPLVLYWQETSVEFQYHVNKLSVNIGQQYEW